MVDAVTTDLRDATNVLAIDDIVSRLDNLQIGPPQASFSCRDIDPECIKSTN
jgi:hypothetical protein